MAAAARVNFARMVGVGGGGFRHKRGKSGADATVKFGYFTHCVGFGFVDVEGVDERSRDGSCPKPGSGFATI